MSLDFKRSKAKDRNSYFIAIAQICSFNSYSPLENATTPFLITIAAEAGAKAGASIGANEAIKSGAQAGAQAGADAGEKAGAEAGVIAATKAATEVATKTLKEALVKLGAFNKPVGCLLETCYKTLRQLPNPFCTSNCSFGKLSSSF